MKKNTRWFQFVCLNKEVAIKFWKSFWPGSGCRNFFQIFFTVVGLKNYAYFADNSNIVDKLLCVFLKGEMSHWQQSFDFSADPDRGPDPGISNGIFTTPRYGQF